MTARSLDETHDPARTSWVESANGHPDFPVQNLPFGMFSHSDKPPRAGVAIGEMILDLQMECDLVTLLAVAPEQRRGFRRQLSAKLSDPDLREKLSPRTKLVILNSPHNPTGGLIPEADIAAIAEMLRDRDVMVLSDEIYRRIIYEGTPVSISSYPGMLEKTIILDGFSKTYSMTGWRLGYGVMPKWLVEGINLLMVNSNSCTASFTQMAGVTAITGPQGCVVEMVAEFKRRRDAIVAGLNSIPGFRCPVPAGAFYAFANVEGTGIASKAMAEMLLQEAGVACLNGAGFGQHGNGYVRFSYVNSLANIQDAVERIKKLSGKWSG